MGWMDHRGCTGRVSDSIRLVLTQGADLASPAGAGMQHLTIVCRAEYSRVAAERDWETERAPSAWRTTLLLLFAAAEVFHVGLSRVE